MSPFVATLLVVSGLLNLVFGFVMAVLGEGALDNTIAAMAFVFGVLAVVVGHL